MRRTGTYPLRGADTNGGRTVGHQPGYNSPVHVLSYDYGRRDHWSHTAEVP